MSDQGTPGVHGLHLQHSDYRRVLLCLTFTWMFGIRALTDPTYLPFKTVITVTFLRFCLFGFFSEFSFDDSFFLLLHTQDFCQ